MTIKCSPKRLLAQAAQKLARREEIPCPGQSIYKNHQREQGHPFPMACEVLCELLPA